MIAKTFFLVGLNRQFRADNVVTPHTKLYELYSNTMCCQNEMLLKRAIIFSAGRSSRYCRNSPYNVSTTQDQKD